VLGLNFRHSQANSLETRTIDILTQLLKTQPIKCKMLVWLMTVNRNCCCMLSLHFFKVLSKEITNNSCEVHITVLPLPQGPSV